MASKGKKKGKPIYDLMQAPMDVKAYINELGGESGRATILLLASAFADELANMLKARFVPLSPAELENLFYKPHATLGDFSSRTEMAYALGLITQQERHQLDAIRRVRNLCAHSMAQMRLIHPEIKAECAKIFIELESTPDDSLKLRLNNLSLKLLLSFMKRTTKLLEANTGLGRNALSMLIK